MRLIKYMTLMSKLSQIEGRRESLRDMHNHSAKLLQRGVIDEESFLQQSETYSKEIESLEHRKRTALRRYAA